RAGCWLRLPANASAGRRTRAGAPIRLKSSRAQDRARASFFRAGRVHEIEAQAVRLHCARTGVRKSSERKNERGLFLVRPQTPAVPDFGNLFSPSSLSKRNGRFR